MKTASESEIVIWSIAGRPLNARAPDQYSPTADAMNPLEAATIHHSRPRKIMRADPMLANAAAENAAHQSPRDGERVVRRTCTTNAPAQAHTTISAIPETSITSLDTFVSMRLLASPDSHPTDSRENP